MDLTHSTDDDGTPLDERIDVAALDIFRDRERGVPGFHIYFARALE
jgi:hypothetical protein